MNDKQMLEQAIENAKEVVNRLEEQHRELYGYKDSDLFYLAEVIRESKGKGLTVREIGRKSRLLGSMTSDITKDMLKTLVGAGDLLEVSTPSPSGRGRPRVAYVAKEFANI